MIRLFLFLLIAIAVIASPTMATEARVVTLPEDANAWYISVVGPESERGEILMWFDTHDGLADLKRQVHFCTPTYGSPIYNERYATNIKATPTVRVQDASGVVQYEVAGQEVPQTANGLFSEIRSAIRGERRFLPWRHGIEREIERLDEKEAKPVVDTPPLVAPDGPPEVEPAGVNPALAAVLIAVAMVAGLGAGIAMKWQEELRQG